MERRLDLWQEVLRVFMKNTSILSKKLHSNVSYRIVNPIWGSCWEIKIGQGGYGHSYIMMEGVRIGVHILSWLLYKGINIPLDQEVCHLCNNTCCANPQHLYLASHRDNMKYAPLSHGHINSKLSTVLAIQIRGEYSLGKTTERALAKKYRVHRSSIHRLLRGETWQES